MQAYDGSLWRAIVVFVADLSATCGRLTNPAKARQLRSSIEVRRKVSWSAEGPCMKSHHSGQPAAAGVHLAHPHGNAPTPSIECPAYRRSAVLAIARHLIRPRSRLSDAGNQESDVVWRHWAAFAALSVEAPNLIGLFGALCDRPELIQRGEPVERLKHFVVDECGLSQRLWRMLAKSRPRLFHPVRDFYKGDVSDATVDYLRLLDMLGLQVTPPTWWMPTVMYRWGNPDFPYDTFAPEMSGHEPVLRHLAQLVATASAATLEAQRRDWPLVMHWVAEECQFRRLDKGQRRAGWPWLLQNALRWFDRQKAQAERTGRSWNVPFRRVQVGAIELVALSSAYELWEEGQAMRHCADGYAADCEAGDTAIVSVRRVVDRRRVATVRLRRTAGESWTVAQVRGFANAAPAWSVSRTLRLMFPAG